MHISLVMNLFTVALVLGLVLAVTVCEGHGPNIPDVFGYHSKYGIPRALEMKRYEEEIKNGKRIVGGNPAADGEFPYQAGLLIYISIFRSACGATILSSTKLVTAAHCWYDGVNQASYLEVILGSNMFNVGSIRRFTADVVPHEDWDPRLFSSDLAIITVQPFEFTDLVQPIRLPSGLELQDDYVGSTVVASGFGITSDSQPGVSTGSLLNRVTLEVIGNEECATIFGPAGSYIRDSILCTSGADGKSPCSGDSGGALALNSTSGMVMIGVFSFMSSHGCQVGFPAGFTRVTHFVDWIQASL